MKRVLASAMVAALALGGGAVFAAQETKTVRGTVTAVGNDSVTVKVKDQDMKFAVDAKTMVTTRGGGTADRAAKADGKSGPALATVVKPGEAVEVHYHEAAMHAASITVLPTGAPTEAKEKAARPAAATTGGQVTAMTGTSLTVKTASGESTFTVDEKTQFIGTGLGTQSREKAAAGKKQVLADVVGVGDQVSVTWQDVSGTKQASTVRVRSKATK
jgi:hypothetical protein